MFFLFFGVIFLIAAIHTLMEGDQKSGLVGLGVASLFFLVFLARRRKARQDEETLSSATVDGSTCCKCGGSEDVSVRAFLFTYSLILFTSMSPGLFRPICRRCSLLSSLPYTIGTFLVGWWGFPMGPIYTVRAIYVNLRGGVRDIEMSSVPTARSAPLPASGAPRIQLK